MMKKVAILFLLLTMTLSCSTDDDATRSRIAGSWRLVSAEFIQMEENKAIDYAEDNIIYNFKNNGKLIVTGNDNIAHSINEYKYAIKNTDLNEDSKEKQAEGLYVHIDNTAWELIMKEDAMTLSTSYVDGPALNFVRK